MNESSDYHMLTSRLLPPTSTPPASTPRSTIPLSLTTQGYALHAPVHPARRLPFSALQVQTAMKVSKGKSGKGGKDNTHMLEEDEKHGKEAIAPDGRQTAGQGSHLVNVYSTWIGVLKL